MSNSKAGKIYFIESLRKNGKTKIYTGQTRRSVFKRVGEHFDELKKSNSKTYIGRGVNAKLLGSIFSTNRFKAERTIKRMSPATKRLLAKIGASRYRKNI